MLPYDLQNAFGTITNNMDTVLQRIQTLENEILEIHSFFDTIDVPRYTNYGSSIGARLKHLREEKIKFETIKEEK